ncbi:MAG: CofH family radical SAM protein [Candidatus Obscuribacterales bacterium]|nr:CofH family radical SAM protein [Candidatus Obscuribacterales bacterium]
MSTVLEQVLSASHPLSDIAQKVVEGKRLSREDGARLYGSNDMLALAALAEQARIRKAGPGREKYVYYNHNMHLNPTNFCVETCRFCSYANPGLSGNTSYTWTVDRVLAEAEKGVNLGIKEIHMVGGLNPACDLSYYEEVMSSLKAKFPHVHLKAMTAVEIEYLANLEGISYKEALERLIAAGLGSMPGGGAEIFDDAVRERMAVKKTPAATWLEIHGIAHSLGIHSNATMLTGIGENDLNKVDHLILVREQQDRSGGFQCFIPLKCYYEGTDIASEVKEPTAHDLLKDVAISRLLLDNFDHIKAYWIQLGETLAQTAFAFGADDMDGTVLEEKITHAAGAKTPLQLAKEKIEDLIAQAGYVPVERNTVYDILQVKENAVSNSSGNLLPLKERVLELAASR